MPPAPRKNPYRAERIISGFKHFAMWKALTSLAGIATLFLVVRGLPVEQFAAYSILFGLVDVLLVATVVGTTQILTRFVPEIFALHYSWALRRMLGYALLLRFAVLAVTLAVLVALASPFAAMIGLDDWLSALQLYLLVVLFRTGNNTLYQILEAMLHQAVGQGAFAVVTVGRFVGAAALYYNGQLTLHHLILVEIVTDGVGLVLMALGVYRASRANLNDIDRRAEEYQWLRENRRRILVFGLKGYLQVLVIMPFSGMVNRLVIGSQLPAGQVALFGFAQSIFDLMQRFLPAQLLAGLTRPVMAARYSQSGDATEAGVISNAILKVNLVMIGLVTTVLIAGGDAMLLQITLDKYGAPAVTLLLLMCVLMALESWRHVLDQFSHTVERYGFLVFSNGLLGCSLILGLALLPRLGVAALPLANCIGLLVANTMVIWWLRHTGIHYRDDVGGVLGTLVVAALGAGVGTLLHDHIDAWPARAALAAAVYLGCAAALLKPKPAERLMIETLLSRRHAS